ncbi:MAG: histone deacetylase family protein [Pseudomonadota bacterium]
MSTAYYTDSVFALHDMGAGHPECPQRVGSVESALTDSGLLPRLQARDVPDVMRDRLVLAHTEAHIDNVFSMAPQRGRVQIDPDTAMNEHSLAAALRAAGALVAATDAVANGEIANAFCNVRPPGHHAEPDRSMGFCLFSNVAIAALHAVNTLGFDRVAIVDFDVHHGNGTEHCVAHDDRILFCSSFQFPFYPGSYLPSEPNKRVNVPLPAGTSGQEFRAAIEAHWIPAIQDFAPQMIFISAGFDAHREDPLAGLNLEDDDYQWVTERVCELAQNFAQRRIVSGLEGGYALSALGRSAALHVAALLDAGA